MPARPSRPTLSPAPLLLAAALFAACDAGTPPTAELSVLHDWTPVADRFEPGFCRDAMTRVDAFMTERTAGAFVPPASKADTPERWGGTAVVGSLQELVDGMGVFTYSDYNSNQHHQFVNLMTLIDYDAELNPRPYLAESWELSGDGTTLTFRLRPDVFWHDGERTDAYDVAFTWERVTDPATGFPNATFWDRYGRGAGGIEVVDSLTVRFSLEPHAGYLDPWRVVAIMPEHLLADVPAEELGRHPYARTCPVGNGPFVFREHRLDEQWSFQANPAFPESLGGRPWVDRYVYRVIPEETTLLTELLTGNLDVYVQARPDHAARIADSPVAELVAFPFRNVNFLAWNGRRPPLDDARVRRALTLGIDRETMVAALLEGYGVVADGSVPPFHWAHDPAIGADDVHDPAAAGALLDAAGWTDRDGDGVRENAAGEPLEITLTYNAGNQQRADIATIVQDQLARIGVRIEPELLEIPTLVARVLDPTVRDFDGVVFGWVTEFNLDDRALFSSDRLMQPYAFAGMENPRIDALLEEIARTADRDAALPLWREYQRLLSEEHPFTFLFFPERIDGVSTRLNATIDVRGDWVGARDWWIDPDARRGSE